MPRFFLSRVLSRVPGARKRTKMMKTDMDDIGVELLRGTRSCKDSKSWTCIDCGNINMPSQRMLVDLPAFHCYGCGKEGEVEFDFSLKNLKINNTCLVGRVKDQAESELCAPHSASSATEIIHRMDKILSGALHISDDDPNLNPSDIHEKTRVNEPYSERDISKMIRLIVTHGIKEVEDEHEPKVYKIPGATRLSFDFPSICRALADGYPLLTGFGFGKNFDGLKYGQIYKSPIVKKGKKSLGVKKRKILLGHVVILIGAGRRRRTNYYNFLNSDGLKFSTCYDHDGQSVIDERGVIAGGVGRVTAEDIAIRPYKFLRFTRASLRKRTLEEDEEDEES